MSDDPIIRSAELEAATPANGSPDQREARRQAIMGEADYWKDGPKTAALRDEMRRITGITSEPAKSVAADANEEQRARITRELLDPNLTPTARAEKMRELRETLGRLETDDERDARLATDPRERYQMKDPKAYASNKEWLAQYDQDFRTYEVDLADVAHAEGFDAPMVRNLRDAAIELGQQVADTGKAITNEELARAFDRLRVPVKSREALTKLWRSIEG